MLGVKNLFWGFICCLSLIFGSYFILMIEEDFYYELVFVVLLFMLSFLDRKGIFGYLLGNKFKWERICGFDSVFVIFFGWLMSFGFYGEFNW